MRAPEDLDDDVAWKRWTNFRAERRRLLAESIGETENEPVTDES